MEEGDEQMTVNSHSRSRSIKSKKSLASRSMKSSKREGKQRQDKKPAVSGKSKASGISRMNRSGRAANSVKNKHTKSVFSNREEDPNPETLNCLHFERLFRIFTMLTCIHHKSTDKVTFALNACRQAENMLLKSIKTFNELQENSAKLNENDEKAVFKTVAAPA